ncbi:STP1 protein, partial [Plasmodium malariae]
DAKCISECTEYSTWFISKKKYFEEKKGLTSKSCIFKNTSSQFPEKTCNILNPKTFNKIPQCLSPKPDVPSQAPVIENVLSEPKFDERNAEDDLISQDQSLPQVEHLPESAPNSPSESQPNNFPEDTPSDPSQLLTTPEDNSMTHSDSSSEDTQHGDAQITSVPVFSTPEQQTTQDSVYQPPVDQDLNTEGGIKTTSVANEVSIPKTFPSTPVDPKIQGIITSIFFSTFVLIEINYALIGKFKKKKNIRRQVKFLRILLPSHSDKKDIFLSDDHLDHPIHDDEEIIKKLKIYEHKTINNTNMLKRKKDKSKTIIEVHMEVLEKFRNEQWELSKKEFLAMCLEVYTHEEYTSYPNFINDDQMENIKRSNDIEEKKILWNKWIERHRNLSEKLKKEDWFNNLKNEWKKDKAMVNEMEELNKKYLKENEKVSLLEREKVIWRQWISNKRKILEQNMEENWF